ncbi:MAG: YceI family protein [Hyphomicrobium sp.]|jgi:polyisoprenoid-binding protein YceI|nr:YceI family protein [Hyphomicrobium sp.]
MLRRQGSLSLAFLLAGTVSISASEYEIDTKGAHASINFRIPHLGFSWLIGRFDRFGGTFSYDEKNPGASRISVEIETASINSNHAERDKHLRGADFLDVTNFPKATFISKSVTPTGDGKAKIEGDLTLRGVTKSVTIEAEVVGGGNDPWGGYRQGFSGRTKVALSDFGIMRELGPASKDVDLDLHIEGVRQR